MVSYILVVAVLNLGLGFAVGVYLGRRYRAMTAADDPWIMGDAFGQPLFAPPSDDWDAAIGTTTPAGGPTEQRPAEAAVAATADAASGTPTGPQPEEVIQPPPPSPQPEQEKSPSQTSVEELKLTVEQYHDRLAEADEELRTRAQTPDAAAIEACLSSLMSALDEYPQERNQTHGAFEELHRQQLEFGGIRDDLQAAIRRQDEQIETTGEIIKAFDYENGLEEGCRQMVSQTGKLLEMNHGLRDTLDKVMAGVARNEQRLGAVHPAMQSDALTGMVNRAGLETRLFEWWAEDPERTRKLSAAMIDVDHFAQVNQRFGHKVGDKVLRTLAQLLESESRAQGAVARFSGQRFFFLFGDTDARVATEVVERIRQVVEAVPFRYQESDIQLTLSGGVTEATSRDTSHTLFARAEATLEEAKRCGGNLTSCHEGEHPGPVVPATLSMEENHHVPPDHRETLNVSRQ